VRLTKISALLFVQLEMSNFDFAWLVSQTINILFLTLLEKPVILWVFAVPANQFSNHRTLGAFCQDIGCR
jgi:hypothetical protein